MQQQFNIEYTKHGYFPEFDWKAPDCFVLFSANIAKRITPASNAVSKMGKVQVQPD